MKILRSTVLFIAASLSLIGMPDIGKAVSNAPLPFERPYPVTNITAEKSFSVIDHGAKPDDGKDDLPAIRAAIAAAKASGAPSVVIFPKGAYILENSTTNKGAMLQLSDVRSLSINGNGSTVVIKNPDIGFVRLDGCSNVIIRDFIVDYDPLPFSQGIVESADTAAGSFVLSLSKGFPELDEPYLAAKRGFGMLKHREIAGRMKPGAPNFFRIDGYEKIAAGKYRLMLNSKSQSRYFEPGDRYVQIIRSEALASFWNTTLNTTFFNIVNHAAPGCDYIGSSCGNIAILECKVLLKEGRWNVSGADGIHCQQFTIGPWVEGCVLEGMADDAINFYTIPLYVQEKKSETEFVVRGWPLVFPGNILRAFDPREGRLIGEAAVLAVDTASGKKTITLDRVIGIASNGVQKECDHFFNDSRISSHFVIRNNVFRNFRRYGSYIKTHHGVIENNLYEGNSGSAICAKNEPGWPEGFAPRDLAIRRNTVRDSNFELGGDGAIVVAVDSLTHEAAWRGAERILIESNRLHNTGALAIQLFSCADGTIRGNSISADASNYAPRGDTMPYAIRCVNVSNLSLIDNSLRVQAETVIDLTRSAAVTAEHNDLTSIPRKRYAAASGFADTQGKYLWRFESYDGTGFADLSWDDIKRQWRGTKQWTIVGSDSQHPDDGGDSVRTWVSPLNGTVTVSGTARLGSTAPANKGDGIIASIRHNDAIVFGPVDVTPGSATAAHDVKVTVQKGDRIRFIVNMNKNSSSDSTYWNPVIAIE